MHGLVNLNTDHLPCDGLGCWYWLLEPAVVVEVATGGYSSAAAGSIRRCCVWKADKKIAKGVIGWMGSIEDVLETGCDGHDS